MNKWTCLFGLMVYCVSSACLADSSRANERRVYRGTWHSQSTGHSGPMRVRLTDQGNGTYSARFTGRFLVVIPFTYRVELNSHGSSNNGDGQILTAHKQLGPLLGGYSMTTQMDSSYLSGSFQAAGDSGHVQMRRVR